LFVSFHDCGSRFGLPSVECISSAFCSSCRLFSDFLAADSVFVVHFDFGNSYLQLEKIASELVINVSFLKAPQTEGMAHGSYRSWKSLDNILEIFKALKSMEKSLNSMEIILDKCDADLDNCDYPCIFCLV